MIGWLKKRLAAKPATKPEPTARTSPENCALWHDVVRALDAKPRTSK
jgi:hypothetical protein